MATSRCMLPFHRLIARLHLCVKIGTSLLNSFISALKVATNIRRLDLTETSRCNTIF